jgi:L-ascorbate metabolism protein UlaG (beta-lactamase superfamily)
MHTIRRPAAVKPGRREQAPTTSDGRIVPTSIGVHRGSRDDKVWHMRMVKYTHACVRLHDGDRDLLIDPGTWAEDAALDGAGDVLVTHEHADHIDLDRLIAAYRANPALRVFMPSAVATQVIEKSPSFEPATHAIAVGDSFTAGGFPIRAVGGHHAEVYDGLPGCANIGYVVADAIYHPGDSVFVPDGRVDTLLVPTSGPWLKLAEAIDFVRAVRPARAYSIHDALLSEKGEALVDRLLAAKGETDYGRIPLGDSIDL